MWKHTFVADTGWINEFVSGYLRLISLIFKRSLMCDLKTNPCLMEGQGCVLVIFFKYLSPAHFLINTLPKLYITTTAVYTASRCFCFIIYLFILSSQSTRRRCQNLNHYHCNMIQPRGIVTLRDPLKRLHSNGTLCQHRELLRTQAGGTRVQALCIQRTGELVEVGDFKGEIRPADKRTGGSVRWKRVGAFLRDSAQNGGVIDWLRERERERLLIWLTCADTAKLLKY